MLLIKHFHNAKIIAAIPIFISVNIVALLTWYIHIPQQKMPLILGVVAVLGIIAGGLVDLDNRITGRLKNIFYTLIAFSISSISVQLTFGDPFKFPLLMTALTFVFTLLGTLGLRYSTIAFGTLVIALYTTLTYQPDHPWYLNSILILCGTLLYSIITVIVHIIFPYRPVQDNMAKAFSALADYLESKALFFDPDDIEQLENKQINSAMKNMKLVQAFNLCRTALFYRIKAQHRHIRTTQIIQYYFIAQDIHERANSSHVNYEVLTQNLKNTDLIFRIQRLIELQAQACRDIALCLQQNKTYVYNSRLERAVEGIAQSFEHYSQTHQVPAHQLTIVETLITNLQSIDRQLRHLSQNQFMQDQKTDHSKIYEESVTGLNNLWLKVRSNLNFDSQLFRHAVRLSIVVALCCGIVEIFELEHGYWILLTAIFVCQPNYSATKVRLKQRIIGTILGVIVGLLFPYMNPTLPLQLGVVVATSTLFFFFRSNNYSFSTFFITLQVLVSFNIMGVEIETAAYSRIIDTLVGAFIAWLAVSYLWPDWKYSQLDKVIRHAISSNTKYLLYVIAQLQFGKCDNLQYRIARRKAHDAAAALSTLFSDMNNEPKKYRTYLNDSFELLKMNYALLSYISALGAYRKPIKQTEQSIHFLAEFYPIAKKVIYTLDHIESLRIEIFEKLQQNINESLKSFNDEQNHQLNRTEFSVPIQQLNMISQILFPLYQILHQKKILSTKDTE